MAEFRDHSIQYCDLQVSPSVWLAFGGGTGLLCKRAPGTCGTLLALPFLAIAVYSPFLYLTFTLLVIITGVSICARAVQQFGVHDHPGIVWDEIAGMLLTMVALPVNLQTVVLGFVLFRLFDIFKPWPISVIDRRVKGGTGIMADDLAAAVFANVSMQILHGLGFL